MAIVHADTSTGIVQPLTELGPACREVGSLLVVDAVLSLGGYEVSFDNWALDAAVGGMVVPAPVPVPIPGPMPLPGIIPPPFDDPVC